MAMIGFLIYAFIHQTDQQAAQERCEWKITNCCSENAGAEWKCVNVEDFSPSTCAGLILCPQVISPKPSLNCVNVNGVCVAK